MWKKSSDHATEPASQSESGAPVPPARADAAAPERFGQNRVKEHKRSVLSPSMTLKGDISGTEDLVLEGKMEGTISLPKNEILIGADGQVKADLTALKVTVEGHVMGDVRGSERVEIKHSGRVEGNIVAPRVVLEDGCQFKGSVEMNIEGTSSAKGQDQAASRTQESKKSEPSNNTKVSQYSSQQVKSRATSAS